MCHLNSDSTDDRMKSMVRCAPSLTEPSVTRRSPKISHKNWEPVVEWMMPAAVYRLESGVEFSTQEVSRCGDAMGQGLLSTNLQNLRLSLVYPAPRPEQDGNN